MSSSTLLSVLILEDYEALAASMLRNVRRLGAEGRVAHTLAEARAALMSRRADIALIDFNLPDGTGAEFAAWALAEGKVGVAYCVTAASDMPTIVEAMRCGFTDVLAKPVDVDKLSELLQRPEIARSEANDWKDRYQPELVGHDERLLAQMQLLQAAADTDCTVLVTGETGTGKELVASLVHRSSSRKDGPFITLNCAALPEALVESELFGHTKGAFTGALQSREGRILAASGGTLFLDEIGDLPLAAQAKLLRFLQCHTVMSVGADRETVVDVRVVAATHRNLQEMVAKNEFRADLLYRLSVITVELPPLRERQGDILELARHFIQLSNKKRGRAVTGWDPSAEAFFLNNAWIGNVRELSNIIDRAVILKREGVLSAADLLPRGLAPRTPSQPSAVVVPSRGHALPSSPSSSPQVPAAPPPSVETVVAPAVIEGLNLRTALEDVERKLIGRALAKSNGNRTEAAALLGLNRTTLVEKMRKLP